MTARTHDLGAITALGIIVLLEPLRAMTLATALVAVLANQIGGILPDIDQPTAPLWRNLPEGHIFGKVFGKSVGGHRFLTHSLLGVGLFALLAHLLLAALQPAIPHINTGYVWWAFLIGILSHLILDTLTKEGVPWLLPLPHKLGLPPVKDLRITTGKAVETLLFFPALLLVDIWFIAGHYQELLYFVHHFIT